MNADFIRLKNLEGELKLTHMTNSLSCSVTSKELVFQKPHTTYHLFLADILSMLPVTVPSQNVSFRHQSEFVRSEFSSDYYKLTAKWVRIVTRSGVVERENMEFIVPLSSKMLAYISDFGGLQAI
ncbi:hypothetical protein EDM56_17225 [Brevibacillus fluminis]|uniref:Uncharacterized protein n=1 Tax=Brevibacillus fluminis TaxID=511487 RepID=A0A3M8DH26_9BACL|nr:hypothetical protein [Brevibacillus fluminis]RNB87400.1 hypothetical protein EDM56_17225 [Brevibacillus fluminis]